MNWNHHLLHSTFSRGNHHQLVGRCADDSSLMYCTFNLYKSRCTLAVSFESYFLCLKQHYSTVLYIFLVVTLLCVQCPVSLTYLNFFFHFKLFTILNNWVLSHNPSCQVQCRSKGRGRGARAPPPSFFS